MFSLIIGIALHAVGATSAAVCYTPQKKVKGWSWQTYWIVQALFCWLLLPIAGAILTIPELGKVLSEAPRDAMLKSFLLGMAYGVGGTAFGIAIRYIGFSLTYAIAVGLSAVLGSVAVPVIDGSLADKAGKPGFALVLVGVLVSGVGIGLYGWAGRSKESDLGAAATAQGFSLVKGLLISLLAGVLSAVYNLALGAGGPIEAVAAAHGAGDWKGNVTFIFANSGAFLTTAVYCVYLAIRHKSMREFVELPAGEKQPSLPINFAMAILTGFLWYAQFFFYNLGHQRIKYDSSSWAIHMTMLVLISNLVGMMLREWAACRPQTRRRLYAALVVLLGAVLLMAWGNYLGEEKKV